MVLACDFSGFTLVTYSIFLILRPQARLRLLVHGHLLVRKHIIARESELMVLAAGMGILQRGYDAVALEHVVTHFSIILDNFSTSPATPNTHNLALKYVAAPNPVIIRKRLVLIRKSTRFFFIRHHDILIEREVVGRIGGARRMRGARGDIDILLQLRKRLPMSTKRSLLPLMLILRRLHLLLVGCLKQCVFAGGARVFVYLRSTCFIISVILNLSLFQNGGSATLTIFLHLLALLNLPLQLLHILLNRRVKCRQDLRHHLVGGDGCRRCSTGATGGFHGEVLLINLPLLLYSSNRSKRVHFLLLATLPLPRPASRLRRLRLAEILVVEGWRVRVVAESSLRLHGKLEVFGIDIGVELGPRIR